MSSSLPHYSWQKVIRLRLAICAIMAGMTIFFLPTVQAQEDRQTLTSENSAEKPARRIGEATATILQAQANGSLAGPALPMLGATATLSWQRYLDSYKHPIPETFTRKLDEVSTR